ncbi:MAG: 50S ribosomal protein L13 [Phycisphaerae bacterium]|nr:50S ribosomal protein L13 [Phycisphaerae bacterium]MBM90527.1 50S ribosomal protein L13 [Phycisphaerae bacterium]HCT44561.1 50S ribosomal protein L13 [Phycisphaerales bacterium]
MAKNGEVAKQWRTVDATDQSLGRLASDIATVLMGKHRPEYTPHVDCGDFVIVTNASQIKLTGRKAEQKMRQTYTGFPGGQKTETYGHLRDRKPELLIEDAVRRMLPKSRLGRQMLKKLKVYAGTDHPHAGVNAIDLY